MKPTPALPVEFHYKDSKGNHQHIRTSYTHARNLVVLLLEKLRLDEIRDLYYTANNISHKLDYENTEV